MRVIGPVLLLLVLSLIVIVPQLNQQEDEAQPSTGVIPASETSGIVDPIGGSQIPDSENNVPDPVAISPDDRPLPDPAPFVADDSVLAFVRDGEAVNPGLPEEQGRIYLLHRWRAGVEVPDTAEAPRVSEIAEQSRRLRGKRFLMVLTLIENPQPRVLEKNPTKLERIWEVFGSDSDGHLHRVDFIKKPKNLPSGSDVVMEGDFLRLYRYQTIAGQEAMVPHWVANTLEPYQSPFVTKGNRFFPLWVIGVLALGTLILLIAIQDRGPRRPLSRRRKT